MIEDGSRKTEVGWFYAIYWFLSEGIGEVILYFGGWHEGKKAW